MILAILWCLAARDPVLAQCIDYTDFMHVVREVGMPDWGQGVAVSGNRVYVADSRSGLQIVDISMPESPVIVASKDTPGEAHDVAVSGFFAYVADGSSGLQVVLVATESPSIVGSVPIPGPGAEWVAVSGNHAYVTSGLFGLWKLWVVDVTAWAAPIIVAEISLPNCAHEVAVAGNYAYVANDASGLQVVDISVPEEPRIVWNSQLVGAQCVAVSGSFAYVSSLVFDMLWILDITTPQAPVILGSVHGDGGSGIAVSETSVFRGGLSVVDVSDPTFLRHVGGIGIGGYDLAIVGNYAYVSTTQGLVVVDVTRPDTPIVGSAESPHSAACGVAVSGHYAYLADGVNGLRLVDISSPEAPEPVAGVDTPGVAQSVAVTPTHAYVTYIITPLTGGLQVVDISTPQAPETVTQLPTPFPVNDVAISGSYAYVAVADSGLRIIDITTPEFPEIVGSLDTPDHAIRLAVSGNYAYIADYGSGLQVVDITVPEKPVIVGSVDTPDIAEDVAVSGRYAYVAVADSGLCIVDVMNPESPAIVGRVGTWDFARGVAVSGSHAYVADGGAGVQVVDVTVPGSPFIVGSAENLGGGGWAYDIAISGGYAYAAFDSKGLQVMPLQCPVISPVFLTSFTLSCADGGVEARWSVPVEKGDGDFRLTARRGSERWSVPVARQTGPDFVAFDHATVLAEGGHVSYRLEYRAPGQDWIVLAEQSLEVAVEGSMTRLLSPYPNPARDRLVIPFSIGRGQRAQLSVFDAAGRAVRSVPEAKLPAGSSGQWVWYGEDEQGVRVAAGIYFVRLQIASRTLTRKVVLVQ